MTSAVDPVPGARAGVELVVRAQPTREDRKRYRAEFLSELDGLPPAGQLRHAAGVLRQTFALRAALGASAVHVEGRAMDASVSSAKRFRCQVLRWHDWRTFSAPDGDRYRACSVCHRDEPLRLLFTSPPPGRGFGLTRGEL
jgi:hypothetical protein